MEKLTRKQSGLFILLIYLFDITVGLAVYLIGQKWFADRVVAMFIADLVMTLVIYLLGNMIGNASLYDPYWSVIPPFIILVWLLENPALVSLQSLILLGGVCMGNKIDLQLVEKLARIRTTGLAL